jgi:hypothetical protein
MHRAAVLRMSGSAGVCAMFGHAVLHASVRCGMHAAVGADLAAFLRTGGRPVPMQRMGQRGLAVLRMILGRCTVVRVIVRLCGLLREYRRQRQ